MRKITILFCCLLVAACGSNPVSTIAPTVNPDATTQTDNNNDIVPQGTGLPDEYAPQAGDNLLSRSEVYPESILINVMESYPLQFSLQITGSLPNPCHYLRIIIYPPDVQNRIEIDLYSVVNPQTMCTEVLKPFEVSIPLGSYPTGNYSIFINGSLVGEIDA